MEWIAMLVVFGLALAVVLAAGNRNKAYREFVKKRDEVAALRSQLADLRAEKAGLDAERVAIRRERDRLSKQRPNTELTGPTGLHDHDEAN